MHAAQSIPRGASVQVERVEAAGKLDAQMSALAIGIIAVEPGKIDLGVSGMFLSEADYQNSTGVGLSAVETENGTIRHSDGAGTFEAEAFGDTYRMFVSPLPDADTVRAKITGMVLAAVKSETESVEAFDPINARPEETVQVSDSLELESADRIRMVLQAPFRLRAWDVNGTITTPDARLPVYSGEHFEPVAPVGGSELVARHGQARLLVFDVYEGTASVTVPAGNLEAIYAEDLIVDVHGSVRGYSESSNDPAYESKGNVSVSLAAASQSVQLRLQPDEPSKDGPEAARDIPPTEPEPESNAIPPGSAAPDQGLSYWWAWLMAAAVVAMAAAVVRRRLRHRFEALRRDFLAEEYGDVVRRARPLLRNRRHRVDAGSMAIVAAARSGDTEHAMVLFGRVASFPEAEQEGLDYLAACIAAARGEVDVAAEILACLETQPGAVPRKDSWRTDAVPCPERDATGLEGYA